MWPVTTAQPRANGRRDSHDGTDDGGSGLSSVSSIPLTPDTAAAAAAEQSIGSLVRDATAHLSTLVRAEVELARSEITGEVKKALRGSVFLIVALVVVLLSFPFLFITIAEVIAVWLPQWAGFLIVWGFMIAVAGGCGYAGYRRMRRIRAPQRTMGSVRDTATALKRPGGSAA
ncbi:MAG TPA: phage holin family protein [Pseudonocardiaceae bacterium]|jgi:hypothetical protein|nr:phage holin family protein [Pseudonocardiaceae bacterium]